MAETEVKIQKLAEEPKAAVVKDGPLSALRGEWADGDGYHEEDDTEELFEASEAVLGEVEEEEEDSLSFSPEWTKLELLAWGREAGFELEVTMRNNKSQIIQALEEALSADA